MNISLRSFAQVAVKSVANLSLNQFLQSGNLKLPVTTAVFNMGSATDCPSKKLGFCQAYKSNGKHCCYAMKAERTMYPHVLPYRTTQEKYWKQVTVEKFVTEFLLINALKKIPFTAIRFNESGDFWSQKCVDKLEEISHKLSLFGIKVYCYTARKDLDFSKVKHTIISGSNFQKDGIPNIFKMILKEEDRPKGYGVCKRDCSVCNRCMKRNMKTVILVH
jgi:hypothetical protein